MLELKNLSKYYNTDNVVTLGLSNVNLKLNKNEIVAIVGDSGAGKSTLLNVICGIDSYDDGELLFKGNETSYFNQTDMDNYRKEHVGFIFQNYNILDSYTVLQNVMVPLQIKGFSKKEAKERATELIDQVGLSHRIHNKGVKLSGGEKQRCVIARALASDCEILACDEPTGNLDSKSGKEIIELIHKVAKDKLVLIVTHNYDEVKDIVTRKIKVADGRIVEDVKFDEIPEDENEVVAFTDKKVKPATIFNFGFQNILSTPKKTIFTFIVFVIMSLIAFYLYLSCMASSQVSFFDPDSQFVNHENNRLIAYMHDHSGIEEGVLKNVSGKYYVNSFYEDYLFSIKFYKNN
ncbi:MAG: ABC transporter ATP-binding protein, partial [Anaeroplasmataceae bacterium]|nr:ABC transporter ATP-binding protein [Anaeroplasmataceae bacterium]